MSPNSKQRSEHLRTLARLIVRESNPDYGNTVHILPLAKQLMAAGECGIDAAKRHIAWAIRDGRHDWLVETGKPVGMPPTEPQHGGKRPNATGRPKK